MPGQHSLTSLDRREPGQPRHLHRGPTRQQPAPPRPILADPVHSGASGQPVLSLSIRRPLGATPSSIRIASGEHALPREQTSRVQLQLTRHASTRHARAKQARSVLGPHLRLNQDRPVCDRTRV